MIHWNWNKVNFYNSALKPLSRLPNRSKLKTTLLRGIFIVETFVTSRFTRKWHGFHLWLSKIEGNWWEKLTTTVHYALGLRNNGHAPIHSGIEYLKRLETFATQLSKHKRTLWNEWCTIMVEIMYLSFSVICQSWGTRLRHVPEMCLFLASFFPSSENGIWKSL